MKLKMYGAISITLVCVGLCLIVVIDGYSIADRVFEHFNIPYWTKGKTGLHISNYMSIFIFAVAIILSKKSTLGRVTKLGVYIAYIGIAIIICSSISYIVSLN